MICLIGPGCVVLLRSVEPLEGADDMRRLRGQKRGDAGSGLKVHQLCNGPAKLCMAMDIDKARFDKTDLVTSQELWLEDGMPVSDHDVVISARVGLNSAAPEWAAKPWRFYVRGNKSVSVRDKMAETVSNSVKNIVLT